jgi:hypothetical protein
MRWILPLLLVISGSGACFSQSTNSGDIRGSVTDPTGALVPGVTVTVLNVDTGVSKDYATNQDGLYDTSSIVAGNYKVTFAKTGFEELVRGPITLQVGFTTVNAQLKIGAATVQVTVNTDVPLLQTESGDQTATLDSKSMAQLPQVTQDWENFMILLPGTTGCSGNSCNEGSTNPGQGVSSNGNLPYSNILADGASTTLSHSQNANPAIFETVDELQVSLSSFSAQYGIGGMIINQISKGGTNQFHGSGYDYMQNDDFNSRPYDFTSSPNPVAFLRYHNFGASIGGPILRKKMFFFFDYDQIVDHGSASNSTQTIPTAAIMGGDFSTETRTLYDPTTQTIATDANGNPYPVRKSFIDEYGTNAIPTAMFDSVAANFQKFYPTPSSHIPDGKFVNGAVDSIGLLQNNWYSSVPQSTPYRKFFGRLDYDVTPNNRITMSDTQSDTPVIYPNSVTACPIGCQAGDVDNNNAQISDVWNINPHTINEARIGYTDQLNFFADLTLGKGYAAQLGWQFAEADTIPAIEFTNTYPYAWITPQSNAVYKEHVFDPSDVVTMIHGKHILHFGGEMLIYRDDSTAWGNTNAGTFTFSGQYTQQWKLDSKGVASPDTSGSGVEYADFLLGLSTSWGAAVTPEYGGRFKSPQMFVQDDIKLRPNLTVNLGLRYQINHGWNEVHGNEDSFDPTVINPATNTLGAYWYGNTHANGRTALQANVFDTILPRVGASWLVDPKTTVRGGWGLYSYNWSLDNYGSGMGSPFGASGGTSDQTNGITPNVKLDGTGTYYGTTTPLPYTQASTSPTRFNGQGAGYNPYHTPVAKIYQWNFAIQRQLGSNYMAEIAYVASHGFDLTFPTDINAVPLNALSSGDSLSCGNGTSVGCARPYPNYQSIGGNVYSGISNYNSLQASFTKRLTSGVSFSVNYVWSHFLDDQDSAGWGSHQGPTNYQDAANPAADYSNSNFDVRNVAKGNVVYRLPFGRGMQFLNTNSLLDLLIGGWQISGTAVLSSGQPFSVTVGGGNTYEQAGSQFPNRVPGVNWKARNPTLDEWFNPAAFSDPGPGGLGNVKRNSFYGPGYQSINLSGGKTFSLPWENVKIQIRADAQNAFNHTSWGQVGATGLSSPDANGVFQGPNTQQITGDAISGRNVQLGARVSF